MHMADMAGLSTLGHDESPPSCRKLQLSLPLYTDWVHGEDSWGGAGTQRDRLSGCLISLASSSVSQAELCPTWGRTCAPRGANTRGAARSLAEKEKAARVLLPSAGGAAEMAATGSVQTARVTPSQAGLRLLSSQPVNLPCAGAGPITT